MNDRWEQVLSESWMRVSERIIEQLKQLEDTKDKDRLEMVRSLRFVLGVLQRSLVGWTQWVGNPDIMTMFSEDDLKNMTKKLAEFTRSFIEYDMKMTWLGAKKGLKAPKKAVKKPKEDRTERFYV
ncbi:MAG: hypothetical protein CW716_01335 [Candidatus Bathyarchaeum sp.]|nr:MAG: hypothetical protein CW716_01335 [Candidatus Bathyarchaeum sp.]